MRSSPLSQGREAHKASLTKRRKAQGRSPFVVRASPLHLGAPGGWRRPLRRGDRPERGS